MEAFPPDHPLAPGPAALELFYTDETGARCSPDDAVDTALDGGWQTAEPRVVALLNDPAAKPYDRYLALSALAAWGSAVGYRAVVEAAAEPEAVVWRELSLDRLHSVDDTFALLAEAVTGSYDMAEERDTLGPRHEALTALLSRAAELYFGRALSEQGLLRADIDELHGPLLAAINDGIARVTRGEQAPFDLAIQTAGLIAALAQVDQPSADREARRLLALRPDDPAVRRELGM